MTSTPWNQLEAAAYLIDQAAVSPKNRVPRGGGRPKPLVTVLTRTLTCLRDDLGCGEGEANRAVRHLLQALVPAPRRVEPELVSKKQRRGKRR